MKEIKVYVAGHNGMVGSSICRLLKKYKNIKIITRSKNKLDLTDQVAVRKFFKQIKIDQVYLAAAKVGGIYANNNFPAEFIYDNLMIQSNIIHSAKQSGVKKLLFLGSSCIYPKITKQPIKESQLLTGPLEQTNESYAIAKIAGIKLCESFNRQYKKLGLDYRCLMPTNLYGVGDKYDLLNSHVIPSLIIRFHKAKVKKSRKVNVWGSGKPRREFLFVDDLAKASFYIMNLSKAAYKKNTGIRLNHINVGSGYEISIENLAEKIKKIVGFEGKINFDKSKPDGTEKKLMDSQILSSLGWKPQIDFDEGLKLTYKDFLKNKLI